MGGIAYNQQRRQVKRLTVFHRSRISPAQFLTYLQGEAPYSETFLYGPNGAKVSRKEYDAAITRLQNLLRK